MNTLFPYLIIFGALVGFVLLYFVIRLAVYDAILKARRYERSGSFENEDKPLY